MEEGSRLARLASVWAMALDVWGEAKAARRFLFEPHPLLHDRRPVDVVLENELGRPVVEGILGRLKYGAAVVTAQTLDHVNPEPRVPVALPIVVHDCGFRRGDDFCQHSAEGERGLEPLPLAFAHAIGSSPLFSRASSPVRVFRRERDLL